MRRKGRGDEAQGYSERATAISNSYKDVVMPEINHVIRV